MELSTNIPAWLARLFAIDVPADATIDAVELSCRAGVSWLLVVVSILALAGVAVLYFTERGTIGPLRRIFAITLRGSLLALLVLLLAKPVLSLVLKRERPRGVVLLLDNSQSMTLADRRLNAADKLRVAIAKGLLPPTTRLDAIMDPLAIQEGSKPMARADMARAMLSNAEIKLIERLEKHGPLRPFVFGLDVRSPVQDDKDAPAVETSAEKATRHLLGRYRPNEAGTALAESLVKVLQGKEGELPAAVVLITDGQDNASKFTFSPQEVLTEAAEECKRLGVPLYIYGVGTSEGGSLQLREVLAPETLFAEDLVTVPVRYRAQGFKGGTVAITLKLGGRQAGYREVKAQTGDDLRETFRFVVPKGEGGEDVRKLEVNIELKGNPAFKDSASRSLRVVDQKIKILYIEKSPRWEFKFLQPALMRDKRVQAEFLLLNAAPEVAKERPFIAEFPRSREEFFGAKYNLIVLGDVPAEYLGKEHQAWMREFVQDGGGLVAIAGRQHMPGDYVSRPTIGGGTGESDAPLAEVFPVEFDKQKFGLESDTRTQEYQPTLTPEGERSQMLMLADTPEESVDVWQKQLPGFHWFYPVKKLRPAAVPLVINPRAKMGEGPMPIISTHHYGKGQVVFMSSDETWRWRWNHHDKYFVRFWGQVIYQVGLPSLLGDNARRVQVALERSQATIGTPGSIYVRLLNKDHTPRTDEKVEATLDGFDDKDVKVSSQKLVLSRKGPPGEYAALLAHDRKGRYELRVNNPDPHMYSFRVDVPPGHELEDVGMNERALREMAASSGGRFYREEDLHRLPDDLPARTVTYRDRHDVLLYPLGFLLFAVLLTGEWLVRKFANLS